MEHREKLRLAGIKRHGSEEAWRQHLAVSARKAVHTKPQGFAVMKQTDPDRLREITSMGGRASKRKPKE